MKLALQYPDGTRFSYKGFTAKELATILFRVVDVIKAWDCSGVDSNELLKLADEVVE